MKKRKILLIVLVLTIGFASIATNLIIRGETKIGFNDHDFDVFFSEAILDEEDISDGAITTNGKNITFKANDLSIVGSSSVLDYEVTNASSQYDAEVQVLCDVEKVLSEEEIDIKEYLDIINDMDGRVVKTKTKEMGRLSLTLKKSLLSEMDVTIGCRLNVSAKGTEDKGVIDDDMSSKKLSGYLVDQENAVLPNTTIVIFPVDPRNPIVTSSNENAYIDPIELEVGSYEAFIVDLKKDDLVDLSKEKIESVAKTKVNFTTSSSKPIVFLNNYKIVDSLDGLKYKVIFNGEISFPVKEVENGSLYGELPKPEKLGYTFVGWYKDTEFAEKVEEDETVNLTHNLNVYPKYTPNTYTITFDAKGGSEVSPKEVTYDSVYGKLEEPERIGYTFSGWFLNDELITEERVVKITNNSVLEARWNAKSINVEFDSLGGSEVSPKEVFFDAKFGSLPVPTRIGYAFVGWYKDADYKELVEEETKVEDTENITLYAKWSANKYIISFDSNGGSEVSPKEVTYNGIYGELDAPERSGYTFIGWYNKEELVTGESRVGVTEDTTLVAKYEAKKFQVVLNANGGEIETPFVEVTYDGTYVGLPSPSKTGYTFVGWYYNNEKIESSTKVTNAHDITIDAKYTANKYQVSFNANGGSVSQTVKEVTYDAAYGTLPTPTRSGYTFNGWYTETANGTQVVDTTKVNKATNHTVYAHWTAKTGIEYKVYHYQQNVGGDATKHDASNYTLVSTDNKSGTTDETVTPSVNTYTGFTSPSVSSLKVLADGSATLSYYYTRNEYTLTVNKGVGVSEVTGNGKHQYGENVTIGYTIANGYTYKNITGDKTTVSFAMPASNVTVTVNASENTYTISYVMNNGTNNASNPTTYKVTSNDITLATPTRTGYTFTGWTGSNGTSANKTVKIAKGSYGNKSYTANWKANTYTVSFNANGGNAVNSTLTVTYDGTYGNSLPTPTRDGYTFAGWYTAASGGNKIESTTKVAITSNQTLYAHWTAKTYSITYNLNSGTAGTNKPTSAKYDSVVTISNPTRTGYTFAGWTVTSGLNTTTAKYGTSNTAVTSGISGTTTKVKAEYFKNLTTGTSVTLTANWTAKTYTVSFNANGGNAVSSTITATYNSTYGTLPTATRTGYTFAGWYTAASGGNKIESTTKVTITANQTLYAHWMRSVWAYDYSGNVQQFTTPYNGNYKIELWGAGISGSYTSGNITLNKDNILYLYVGGYNAASSIGGYNGGGNGSSGRRSSTGGGATDIRLVNGTWNNATGLRSRIMIAAGAGGTSHKGTGAPGGGLVGYTGEASCTDKIAYGYGGTQIAGGKGGVFNWGGTGPTNGSFAIGGVGNSEYGGGGGGGYYGGGGSGVFSDSCGGGGSGSSYISGHAGCIAIKSATDQTPKVTTYSTIANSYHYSGYKFTNTVIVDGKGYKWTTSKGSYTGMPTHDGKSTMTGNSGNGYAKITYLGN